MALLGRVLLLLLLLTVTCSVCAFNFAPDYAQVIPDPSEDSESLFGYAVALRSQTSEDNSIPGIVIGAPRGNSGFSTMKSVNRPGKVYWCPLVGEQPCKEAPIDKKPGPYVSDIRGNRSLSYFGSTLDAMTSGNGFAVCAPHWRNEPVSITSYMNGMCYWEEDIMNPQPNKNKIYTLYDAKRQGLKDGVETVFYAYGESGFSVSVNQDGSEILIGAPGVYTWKGAVLRYDIYSGEIHKPDTTYVDHYPASIQNESYFGYSVGYGHFPESNYTVYVGGAPRASDLKGKVFMFDFVNNSGSWEYDILKEWEGTQMGEYFGSSLVVADFNNDGYDDILVGAPQFSLKSRTVMDSAGDEGCVYVFITDPQTGGWKDSERPVRVMGSEQHGARFGTAISLLGDINMDSHMDVAVGAPYEDDLRGVVYIYHGSRAGLNLEYSQRLVARDISPSLQGFGAALSRGFDVDQNHYSDLAIGAYMSNNVVLVKTYPIVTIIPEVIPSVKKIGFNDKEFNASVCVTYSGSYAPSKIAAVITVKADPNYKRAHFVDGKKDYSYNTTLVYGADPDCRNFTLIIQEQKNFYKPIDISMEYEIQSQKKRSLTPDKNDSFCKDCPVLNSTQAHWWKVPYGLGCKEDSHCSIDLALSASFINTSSVFVIGTEDFISLKMDLESKNDPAYLSKLSIIFPRSTQHRRIPGDCLENGTAEFREHMIQLVCDIDGPLKQGMKYSLTLELDMTNVPLSMKQLEVNISAISSDEDSNELNNHVQLKLPMRADIDVTITGNSVPEQLAFVGKKKDSKEEFIQDKEFTHSFLITNRGPSPVKPVTLDFTVPYGAFIGSKFVDLLDVSKPLIDMQRQHLSCKVLKGSDSLEGGVVRSTTNRKAVERLQDVSPNRTLALDCSFSHIRCMEVHCIMEHQFVKKTSALISFNLKTKLREAESFLRNKDLIIVTSSLLLESPDLNVPEKKVQITLWRTLPGEGVAWWVIFLAILGGIIILAAIIWCFYKFGFFRRDKQMQLQAMKHNSLVENEFLCKDSDT